LQFHRLGQRFGWTRYDLAKRHLPILFASGPPPPDAAAYGSLVAGCNSHGDTLPPLKAERQDRLLCVLLDGSEIAGYDFT
jgi:hypothetical protein